MKNSDYKPNFENQANSDKWHSKNITCQIIKGGGIAEKCLKEIHEKYSRTIPGSFTYLIPDLETQDELFSDTLLSLYFAILNKDYSGDSNKLIHSYLWGIYRFKAYEYLRGEIRRREKLDQVIEINSLREENLFDNQNEESFDHGRELKILLQKSQDVFEKMSEKCQKLIGHKYGAFGYEKVSMGSVLDIVGLPTIKSASNKLQRCQGDFFFQIVKHPDPEIRESVRRFFASTKQSHALNLLGEHWEKIALAVRAQKIRKVKKRDLSLFERKYKEELKSYLALWEDESERIRFEELIKTFGKTWTNRLGPEISNERIPSQTVITILTSKETYTEIKSMVSKF